MPSNLNADDFKVVEDYLRKEYFLIRTQTVVLAVALLAAFGVGTVVTAYTAAKAAATSEAEQIAKKMVPLTIENLLAQLEALKTKASAAFSEVEQISAYVGNPLPERIPEIEKEIFVLIANLNNRPNYAVFSCEGRKCVFQLIKCGRVLRDRFSGAVTWLEKASSLFGEILCDAAFCKRDAVETLITSAQAMISDMESRDVDLANLSLHDLGMPTPIRLHYCNAFGS
jgi:hypothetical protein